MNNNYAFLFPGQGSQYVGMGKDLYENFSEARRVYDRAEEILKMDIKKVSFEGPQEELVKTYITQLAVLVHSIAIFEILKDKGMSPAITAGHSLGEYSALYATGAFDFESVLKLVQKRASIMHSITEKNPGTMAAIIGLNEEAVVELCKNTKGIVVPANFNAPDQIVISGEVPAVQEVAAQAKEKGALRVVMLQVSGAFHSPLLENSAEEFQEFSNQFEIKKPRIPIVANVSGEPVQDAKEIRNAMAQQLRSPVLWTKTIKKMKELAVTKFYEIGPGRVLCGLLKRIDRELTGIPINTAEDIKTLTQTEN